MEVFWQALYLALYVFYLCLLARLVIGTVVRLSRRWEPNHGTMVAFELIFSVTDPPLKGLRRIIPPLRLGTVALDLAFLALLILVMVVKAYVVGPLI